MFDRRKSSETQNTFAAAAALLVVSGVLASPAIAATSSLLPCKEATQATLHVHSNELTTTVVSRTAAETSVGKTSLLENVAMSSSENLLAPRAEAAIRDAFQESEALVVVNSAITAPMAGTKTQTETVTEEDEPVKSDLSMNTKLPGISDDDMLRYKKQMYRRDI